MSSADIEMRPAKKRRFFVEDDDRPPVQNSPELNASAKKLPNNSTVPDVDTLQTSREGSVNKRKGKSIERATRTVAEGFDSALFNTLVGEDVPAETIGKIRDASKDNLETAVNLYFDGNWKATRRSPDPTISPAEDEAAPLELGDELWTPPEGSGEVLESDPDERYVGAFGVGAWATRSGKGIIGHGESVSIERTKQQPPVKLGRGGKVVSRPNQKSDVITRFKNQKGEEIGRLPRETASWVSTLIDQKVCSFNGICVFAPDRIRVNDTIYIQLRCSLLKEALQPKRLRGLGDDNRSIELFEEKESEEEKYLRLRQIALIKLFDEIALLPASSNETTIKHKKEGLLRAAEVSEQYEKKQEKSKDPNGSSEEGEDSEELQQDQLDSLYKKAQSFDFNTPEAEPEENFVLSLRRYQKQALYWMLKKEKNSKSEKDVSMHPLWEEYTWPIKDVDDNALPCVRQQDYFYVNPYSGDLSLEFPVQKQNCLGGILADEMGLGKTIEMLSLMHSHKSDLSTSQSQDPKGVSVNSLTRQPKASSRALLAPHTTLVVAPTSLLAQWENEALKASKPGTMNVLVYYGTDKPVDLRDLCCSGSAGSAPDLIITSYGVVLSEYRQIGPNGLLGASLGLFSVDFFRVILDEAHHIKNRRSKTARACYDISAIHRWVLTGTPIVNRLEDLFSLVRFLKVEPWSNFSFWKTFITMPFESKDFMRALNVVQTVLEPLVLRRTKTMKTPDGEALVPLPARTITIEEVELSEKEREIYDYIFTRAKRTFNDNIESGTLLKSYSTIFTQILRLRQTCCHPVLTRNKDIVAEEEDAAVAADTMNNLKDDMDLQELIARFTTSNEEASSEQQDSAMGKFTAHALKQIQTESSGECPICTEEPMIQPAVTGCWHSACKKCLEDYITHQTDRGKTPRCFSCRETLTTRDIFEVIRHTPSFQDSNEDDGTDATPSTQAPRISIRRINPLSPSAHTSAKIHALLSHLSRVPQGSRSVVFSQFTSFFDLISPQLTKAGIPHLRLDGTMPQKARAEVISKFTAPDIFDDVEDDDEEEEEETGDLRHRKHQPKPTAPRSPQPCVLLISLRAGGVGLNLTAANHVFMMDPWWSFAVEAQAIDRVHRMGQMKDVSVTRFVVKSSIEERMLKVQDRKMRIAGSLGLRVGGDGGEEERKKERVEELKLLFE